MSLNRRLFRDAPSPAAYVACPTGIHSWPAPTGDTDATGA